MSEKMPCITKKILLSPLYRMWMNQARTRNPMDRGSAVKGVRGPSVDDDRLKLQASDNDSAIERHERVWIPQDRLGLAQEEETACREKGIDISSKDAEMNEKGKVNLTGDCQPPDLVVEGKIQGRQGSQEEGKRQAVHTSTDPGGTRVDGKITSCSTRHLYFRLPLPLHLHFCTSVHPMSTTTSDDIFGTNQRVRVNQTSVFTNEFILQGLSIDPGGGGASRSLLKLAS
ncbi:hypothetical protein EV359DRAFT_68289 [Lentinula novae-zelandiae]|nr:hypothetical protein EV359DRAFT_68289 [Lentinula novae-zelandiae]